MDEDQIAEIKAALGRPVAAPDFRGVWPVNAPIVAAFCAVGSQWRTTLKILGGDFATRFIGLDYAGAKVALEALGVSITAELWSGLQVMEGAARDALNGDG
jgi:hypothetical protein